uniref:protein-tyrosine-phosphatase n=2 Tax=Panagrellus redivivus TaxID=6233 RepID=A0A7E4W4J0_PANRE
MAAETLHPTPPRYFVPAPCSEIKFGKMRFLITDRPNDMSLDNFVKELEKHNTKAVVRVCEPTYESNLLKEHGIDLKDWQFDDGAPPPRELIEKWIRLVKECFKNAKTDDVVCIAVHCVAGLGRSPLLVAIALLEAGMSCEDAVYLIRSQRRGALNERQLEFLRTYKATGQLRKLRNFSYEDSDKQRKSCNIM